MKFLRVVFLVVPLALLAASPRHMAFGSLKFGMTEKEATKAIDAMLNEPARIKGPGGFNVADVRNHFVNSGTKRPLKLTPVDAALGVGSAQNGRPLVTSYSFLRWEPTVDGARRTWTLFRDIADAKFERKGPKGDYMALEKIQEAGVKGLVTDTWECDGIQIELRLIYVDATKFDPKIMKVEANDGYFIEPRLTAISEPAK